MSFNTIKFFSNDDDTVNSLADAVSTFNTIKFFSNATYSRVFDKLFSFYPAFNTIKFFSNLLHKKVNHL